MSVRGLFFIMLVALFGFAGCSGGSGSADTIDPSGGTPGSGGDDGPIVELPSSDLMYVEAISRATLMYPTHRTSSWTQRCTVDLNAPLAADRDIECYVEAKELDLYFNGMTFAYNVPKTTKCTYLEHHYYWYWRRQPGRGPASYTVETDLAGATSLVTSSPAGRMTLVDGLPVCNYDYSGSNGPNCCVGAYVETRRTETSAGQYETDVTRGEWGGRLGNCAGGVAMDLAETDESSGLPVVMITNLKTGEDSGGEDTQLLGGMSPLSNAEFVRIAGDRRKQKVKDLQSEDVRTMATSTKAVSGRISAVSPMSKRLRSNIYIANYVESGTTPEGLGSVTIDGASVASNPFHEWRCVDDAQEVHARIRLIVREWNLASEFDKGSAGNPELGTGTEIDFPSPENDRRDWDDIDGILNPAYPGGYE